MTRIFITTKNSLEYMNANHGADKIKALGIPMHDWTNPVLDYVWMKVPEQGGPFITLYSPDSFSMHINSEKPGVVTKVLSPKEFWDLAFKILDLEQTLPIAKYQCTFSRDSLGKVAFTDIVDAAGKKLTLSNSDVEFLAKKFGLLVLALLLFFFVPAQSKADRYRDSVLKASAQESLRKQQTKELMDRMLDENFARQWGTKSSDAVPTHPVKIPTVPTVPSIPSYPVLKPTKSTIITITPLYTSPYETNLIIRRSGGG